jgi:hypothetical protein
MEASKKLVLAALLSVPAGYAAYKLHESNPTAAGFLLGAVTVIFGPAVLDWAIEAGRRIPRPQPR